MAIYVEMAAAQFENTNAIRTYPFADGSSLKDANGRELPRDVVVDVHLVVPAEFGNPSSGFESEGLPNVGLKSVHLSDSMVSACFMSKIGDFVQALSVTVSRESFVPYSPYRLEKLAGSSDIGGIVTFGDFSFPGFPYTYLLNGADVHPCCVSAAKPPMLRSFYDRRSGERVSGDAEIDFSKYVLSRKEGTAFSLSLEDGAAEELASGCVDLDVGDACGATPITSINGVYPDDEGNIVLWFH